MARSIGSIHISDNSVTSINDAIQQLMFLMDELRGEHDSTTIKIGPHTHSGITGPAGQDGGVINIPAQNIDHDDLTNVTSDQHHAKLHSATHGPGGVDALKLDNLDTPDDNTDLDSQITQHGLLRKLDNNANHFLDGQGNWNPVVATVTEATDVANAEAHDSTPLWDKIVGGVQVASPQEGADAAYVYAGQWTLVNTTVAGGAASYTITNLGSWPEILVVFRAITKSASEGLVLTVSSDNGSTFFTTSGDYNDIGNTGVEGANTNIGMHSTGATAARSGWVQILNFNVPTPIKMYQRFSIVEAVGLGDGGILAGNIANVALNAIKVASSVSATLNAGTIYVFGR